MVNKELQVADKQELTLPQGELTRGGLYFTPAVDICETDNQLVMFVDMPGVQSDGVNIELRDDVLTIEGRIATRPHLRECLLTEYREGNYFRTFRLTDSVDVNAISASMSHGVLRVILPKVTKAIPKRIQVTSG